MKNFLRRVSAVMLVVAVIFSFSACNPEVSPTPTQAASATSEPTATPDNENSDTTPTNKTEFEIKLERLKNEGYIVSEGLFITSGIEKLRAFYDSTLKGNKGAIDVVNCYGIENDSPVMYTFKLTYDKGKYIIESEDYDDSVKKEYKYLMRYETTYPGRHVYRYVLVDDNTLTWQDIENAMVSSAIVAIPPHQSIGDEIIE